MPGCESKSEFIIIIPIPTSTPLTLSLSHYLTILSSPIFISIPISTINKLNNEAAGLIKQEMLGVGLACARVRQIKRNMFQAQSYLPSPDGRQFHYTPMPTQPMPTQLTTHNSQLTTHNSRSHAHAHTSYCLTVLPSYNVSFLTFALTSSDCQIK